MLVVSCKKLVLDSLLARNSKSQANANSLCIRKVPPPPQTCCPRRVRGACASDPDGGVQW